MKFSATLFLILIILTFTSVLSAPDSDIAYDEGGNFGLKPPAL
jgi:hypothetical protein